MKTLPPPTFNLFDPSAGFEVTHGLLPHWSQAGALVFITWRTADPLPADVVQRLVADREAFLRAAGVDPTVPGWQERVTASSSLSLAVRRYQFALWEGATDQCFGACPLRASANARVVADALRHFDGDRYHLSDFVVMPNHVHVLVAFPDADGLRPQCASWKRFTATALNARHGRAGRLWQSEQFDHLIRNADQFERTRDYIASNPRRAGLRPGEFAHYSIDLPGSPAREPLIAPHAERAGHTVGASP